MRFLELLSELLFPDKCPFCLRVMPRGPAGGRGMCGECRENVVRNPSADPLPHEALGRVLMLYVPLRFHGSARDAMHSYKFGGQVWMSAHFARILYDYILEAGGFDDTDIITCVPISDAGFAKRGFDQSRLIAEELSKLSGIPFAPLLERPGEGRIRTSGRNYAQRASMSRFRAADRSVDIRGARILLVDDIFTTGSTLNECAGLLLDAGAFYVNAACVMSGRQDIGGYVEPEEAV